MLCFFQVEAMNEQQLFCLKQRTFQYDLMNAAQDGDEKRVRVLIAEGIDFHNLDFDGYTAFDYAKMSGHENICFLLAKEYVLLQLLRDYNDSFEEMHDALLSKRDEPPLLLHAIEKILYVFFVISFSQDFKVLLEEYASVISKELGAIESVDTYRPLFINRDPKNHQKASQKANTPLIRAMRHGDKFEVAYLLKSGRDPNEADQFGFTPAHAAARQGKPKRLLALLKFGANILSRDVWGRTPIHVAAACDDKHIVEQIDPLAKRTLPPARPKQECQHMQVVGVLLQYGVSIEDRDFSGATCIHHAAERGMLYMVECLLNHGAAINAINNDRQRPIHRAAIARKWGCVSYLFAHGAQIPKVAVSSSDEDLDNTDQFLPPDKSNPNRALLEYAVITGNEELACGLLRSICCKLMIEDQKYSVWASKVFCLFKKWGEQLKFLVPSPVIKTIIWHATEWPRTCFSSFSSELGKPITKEIMIKHICSSYGPVLQKFLAWGSSRITDIAKERNQLALSELTNDLTIQEKLPGLIETWLANR